MRGEFGYEINFQILLAEFSFEKEKAIIAKSLSKRFQWEMILIGLGQAFVWLTMWPLVLEWLHSLRFMGRVFGS